MDPTGEEKVLTVSIAAYNVEGYLGEALESCVVPNMSLLEVIVVDDGSEDGTAAVARGYVERYPGTFKLISKENGGYGSTINCGLGSAHGRYFRFLDGDDWFDRDGIERLLSVLSSCEDDAVCTPYIRCLVADGRRICIDDMAAVKDERVVLSACPPEKAIAAHSLTYKTEFLKRIGFKMLERCFYTDTHYAYIPMAYARTLRVLHSPLYCYRIGREGQSVSRNGIAKHYGDIVKAIGSFLDLLHYSEDKKELINKEYIKGVAVKESCTVYRYLCLVPCSGRVKAQLVAWDKKLLNYENIYSLCAKTSKVVMALRKTRFLSYRLICWYVVRKYVQQ